LTKYLIFPLKRPGGKNIRNYKSSPGKERDLMCLPISNEANPDVVAAGKDARIKTIISLMDKNDVSDVVIVDDYNEPVGIVTLKNLLKLF
jgi:CBS domain-containing protein